MAKRGEIKPEFDPVALTALIPFRRYPVSVLHALAAPIVVTAIVAACIWLSGRFTLEQAVPAAMIVLISLLVGSLVARYWWNNRWDSFALDVRGIASPGIFGPEYYEWKDLKAVAHVQSVLGRAPGPHEFNLVVFPRARMMPVRLSLPFLDGDERAELFSILQALAKRHAFDFIIEHTPEGQRSLKRLPWLWQ